MDRQKLSDEVLKKLDEANSEAAIKGMRNVLKALEDGDFEALKDVDAQDIYDVVFTGAVGAILIGGTFEADDIHTVRFLDKIYDAMTMSAEAVGTLIAGVAIEYIFEQIKKAEEEE